MALSVVSREKAHKACPCCGLSWWQTALSGFRLWWVILNLCIFSNHKKQMELKSLSQKFWTLIDVLLLFMQHLSGVIWKIVSNALLRCRWQRSPLWSTLKCTISKHSPQRLLFHWDTVIMNLKSPFVNIYLLKVVSHCGFDPLPFGKYQDTSVWNWFPTSVKNRN